MWAVSGQCVCVIHPRIVLTAAHVYFDGPTLYKIRVLYTPLDAASPPRAFPAKLIRYSGQMDVAVLLLDLDTGTTSPLRPCPIAPDSSHLLTPLSSAVLVNFPLTIDLLSQSGTAERARVQKASALVRVPQLFLGAITGLVQKTTRTEQGVTRQFELGCATYKSFAGCSGGSVFAFDSASSQPMLVGLHTEAVYQTDKSGVDILSLVSDEYDGAVASAPTGGDVGSFEGEEEAGAEGRPSRSKRQRVSDPSSHSSAVEFAVTDASPSSTPEDSPVKKVQLKLTDEVKHKAELAVFVVAHTAFSQHPEWNQPALLREAQASQAQPSPATAAAADFDVAIVEVEGEKSRQASPRFLAGRRDQDELYG